MDNLDDKLIDEQSNDYERELNEYPEENFLDVEDDDFVELPEGFAVLNEGDEESYTQDTLNEELMDEYQEGLTDGLSDENEDNEFLDYRVDSLQEFLEKNDQPQGASDERFKIMNPDELSSISFRVTCEVGQTSISLSELSNLKIGDCINFIKWPGMVKLKLNDYLFAEGYLVEIDGMLGVKITNRLSPQNFIELETP